MLHGSKAQHREVDIPGRFRFWQPMLDMQVWKWLGLGRSDKKNKQKKKGFAFVEFSCDCRFRRGEKPERRRRRRLGLNRSRSRQGFGTSDPNPPSTLPRSRCGSSGVQLAGGLTLADGEQHEEGEAGRPSRLTRRRGASGRSSAQAKAPGTRRKGLSPARERKTSDGVLLFF